MSSLTSSHTQSCGVIRSPSTQVRQVWYSQDCDVCGGNPSVSASKPSLPLLTPARTLAIGVLSAAAGSNVVHELEAALWICLCAV